MSAERDATNGFFEQFAPDASGVYAMTAQDTTTTAQVFSLNATWGSFTNRVNRGGAFFTFEAQGGDVYIRLTPAGTAAGTTAANGEKIDNGSSIRRWVPARTPQVDHLCSDADQTLKIWQSSPNYANRPPV